MRLIAVIGVANVVAFGCVRPQTEFAHPARIFWDAAGFGAQVGSNECRISTKGPVAAGAVDWSVGTAVLVLRPEGAASPSRILDWSLTTGSVKDIATLPGEIDYVAADAGHVAFVYRDPSGTCRIAGGDFKDGSLSQRELVPEVSCLPVGLVSTNIFFSRSDSVWRTNLGTAVEEKVSHGTFLSADPAGKLVATLADRGVDLVDIGSPSNVRELRPKIDVRPFGANWNQDGSMIITSETLPSKYLLQRHIALSPCTSAYLLDVKTGEVQLLEAKSCRSEILVASPPACPSWRE